MITVPYAVYHAARMTWATSQEAAVAAARAAGIVPDPTESPATFLAAAITLNARLEDAAGAPLRAQLDALGATFDADCRAAGYEPGERIPGVVR